MIQLRYWPVSKNQKDVRKWLGLAKYVHKYSENYADMGGPLSNLLKRIQIDAGLPPKMMLIKQSRVVLSMP